MHRVMGAETEYGIHAPAAPGSDPVWLSSELVHAYAQGPAALPDDSSRASWDYSEESPLVDARGWSMPREQAHPSQLTNEPAFFASHDVISEGDPAQERSLIMNMVLSNGARFYVDHAHPEYSSPEVTNPLDAVIWDFAGDQVLRDALAGIEQRRTGTQENPDDPDGQELPELKLYKNNTDGKGASYGSHENYLMPRSVPFRQIVSGLTPFFVTRQLICGSGRVGMGQHGETAGYQISQRADFFEAEVGLETTIRRPIINTRDEPHAVADHYRRLHVIVGDANLFQVSHFLKFGTTSLVLGLIERGLTPELEVWEPVTALHQVSHDLSLAQRYRLIDGRRVTALDVQEMYLEAAQRAAGAQPDAQTGQVLRLWSEVLDGLRRGSEAVRTRVEWAAKLHLLEQYRQRDGLDWDDARLALIDVQWSDLEPSRGLAYRLQARGQAEALVSDEQIRAAARRAPEDTRAYFRGECIRRYGRDIAGASWDSVIFRLSGKHRLHKVHTREPLDGTRQHVGALFEAYPAAEDFLRDLLAGER
ncbi:depupylase/deamidase Dop [Acaricomes phytoseiuli]|nr:depupylase/deamidase Dop [Acaricomes phytoseiuli]